jgi:hypothetical protein
MRLGTRPLFGPAKGDDVMRTLWINQQRRVEGADGIGGETSGASVALRERPILDYA